MFSACNVAWPRRPERRELSAIKISSSMPPAAYQRLDANPTIHMQMRFLGSTSWLARSKDHGEPDPSAITAYAIGLRHRAGTASLERQLKAATGPVLDHPFSYATVGREFILSGGGAYDDWSGAGNLLTGSMP